MSRLADLAGELAHTRTIEMTTCRVDDHRMLCTGRFRDVRLLPSVGVNGRRFDAGDLHDLKIHVIVRTRDLVIEDIEVEIDTVPLRDCRGLAHSLDAVKGLSIARGFTGAVKRLAGGTGGCTHLVHLLTTMGPAILQGLWAIQDSGLGDPCDDGASRKAVAAQFLGDSCYAWRKDGEAYGELVDPGITKSS